MFFIFILLLISCVSAQICPTREVDGKDVTQTVVDYGTSPPADALQCVTVNTGTFFLGFFF
jgi:hypothetical protein